MKHYLEDFAVGQKFGSPVLRVDRERMIAFAKEFDPQPFHTDEQAARDTLFQGLAASGWYTAAMTMKLLATGDMQPAGGLIGAGLDEMRWPRPVRPDDDLHIESEIIEVRASKSRPEQGFIKVRTTTFNQNNEAVQTMTANLGTDAPVIAAAVATGDLAVRRCAGVRNELVVLSADKKS